MRIIVVFLCLIASWSASANSAYDKMRSQFNAAQLDSRVILQETMIAGGFLRREYTREFNREIWNAVQDYRNFIRRPGNYEVTENEMLDMARYGAGVIDAWELKRVRLPEAPDVFLTLPIGLDLWADPIDNGAEIQNETNTFRLKFLYLPNEQIPAYHFQLRNQMAGSNDEIVRSEVYFDSFILHSRQGRFNRFVRFHNYHRGGLVGFDMNWSTENAPVHGSRLALMLSSFLAMTIENRFIPNYSLTRLPWDDGPEAPPRSVTPPQAAPSSPPVTARATPPEEPEREGGIGVGSGFYITRNGMVVTNAHVVDGCRRVDVVSRKHGVLEDVPIIARDDERDLALIRTGAPADRFATLRTNVRLGEEIAVFGFPHTQLLDPSGVFTVGHVTAERGLEGNENEFQISAGIQAGNSGGPVLDRFGRVVGVVVAKLNWLALMEADDMPQNLNFAVSADVLSDFLRRNDVFFGTNNDTMDEWTTADVASHARDISVFVACIR